MDELSRSVGEIKGRLDTMEKTITSEMTELRKAIDNISAVPISVYEERQKEIDAELQQHDLSLKGIAEDINQLNSRLDKRRLSLSGRVADFLDDAVVKTIGGGLLVIVLLAIYSSYQGQIKEIEAEIEHTTNIVRDMEGKWELVSVLQRV